MPGPLHSPSPETVGTAASARMFRALLVFLYLLVVLFGCRTALLPERQRVDWIFSGTFGVTFAGICIFHARANGKRFVHAAQWLTVFLWPVIVPVYFTWARGFRGLGLVLLHLVLLVLLWLLVCATALLTSIAVGGSFL
ncbi:MAG: hypothetical protein WD069_04425 [Planctomycetales bacterium]